MLLLWICFGCQEDRLGPGLVKPEAPAASTGVCVLTAQGTPGGLCALLAKLAACEWTCPSSRRPGSLAPLWHWFSHQPHPVY